MTLKITLIPNGPIKLEPGEEGAPRLESTEGDTVLLETAVFLCRCGESKNKPFCDGSHSGAGYTDESRCDRDVLLDAEARDVTVHFNRAICSGAGECVRGLPAVFVSGAEDWIRPANAAVNDIVDVVRRCPSGALTYTVDGKTHRREEAESAVRIVKDGPYAITGQVAFDPPQWSRNASRTCFTLCRCGRTDNAPFCDYSHGEQGWKDD